MPDSESTSKVTLVTGASSGIGEATARRFAKGGHIVVLAARRKDLLDQVASSIEGEGGIALSVPTDLSDAQQTSALVDETLALDAEALRARWIAASATIGQTVRVEVDGGEPVIGVAVDVDADGALVLDGPAGRSVHHVGDVVHARPE